MNQPYSDMRPPPARPSRLWVRPDGQLVYAVAYGPTYPVRALTSPNGFWLLDYSQPQRP